MDLRAVNEHVANYSGIDKKEADRIDSSAMAIAEHAARVCQQARKVLGDRSGPTVVKAVRKAIGYTVP